MSDSNNTQTIATFKGTLLRREHAATQRLVQLVFREGRKDWLCVSRNPADAKLALGKQYYIEGIAKRHGDRIVIHDSKIELLTKKSHKVAWASALCVVLITFGGIAAAFMHKSQTHAAKPVSSKPAAAVTLQQPATQTEPTQTTPDPTPTPTTSTATTTTPRTISSTKASTTKQTNTTQPTTTAAVTTPTDTTPPATTTDPTSTTDPTQPTDPTTDPTPPQDPAPGTDPTQ